MTSCPSDPELLQLLDEQLDLADEAQIVVHVDTCTRCQKRLDDLTRSGEPHPSWLPPEAARGDANVNARNQARHAEDRVGVPEWLEPPSPGPGGVPSAETVEGELDLTADLPSTAVVNRNGGNPDGRGGPGESPAKGGGGAVGATEDRDPVQLGEEGPRSSAAVCPMARNSRSTCWTASTGSATASRRPGRLVSNLGSRTTSVGSLWRIARPCCAIFWPRSSTPADVAASTPTLMTTGTASPATARWWRRPSARRRSGAHRATLRLRPWRGRPRPDHHPCRRAPRIRPRQPPKEWPAITGYDVLTGWAKGVWASSTRHGSSA